VRRGGTASGGNRRPGHASAPSTSSDTCLLNPRSVLAQGPASIARLSFGRLGARSATQRRRTGSQTSSSALHALLPYHARSASRCAYADWSKAATPALRCWKSRSRPWSARGHRSSSPAPYRITARRSAVPAVGFRHARLPHLRSPAPNNSRARSAMPARNVGISRAPA